MVETSEHWARNNFKAGRNGLALCLCWRHRSNRYGDARTQRLVRASVIVMPNVIPKNPPEVSF
ncbi:MAG: hypothetical protein JWP08_1418 [Bryobacterales bacterium]|nr:hypothetical protein [Bryobacterales bacterium]